MKAVLAILILWSLFLLNACATVAHGKFQEVPVLSNPAGAEVLADCGKGAQSAGQTPSSSNSIAKPTAASSL